MSTPPPPRKAITALKVVAYIVGGFVVLLLVGFGLLALTCTGLTR